MNNEERIRMNELASKFLSDYGYNHSKDIQKFINKHKIGKSEVGKLMDLKGKGREAVHRLYGHHIVYDFPIENPKEIKDFIEHIFSDLFTNQGIPILPGEMLEDLNLLKYCKRLQGRENWNLVNGFDILTATISIYSSTKSLSKVLNSNYSIDTFEDFAKKLGVGALELAIAMSTCNPFLFIGAILEITSGIIATLNEGSRVYIEISNNKFRLDVKNNMLSLGESNKRLSLEYKTNQFFLQKDINRFGIDEKLNNILDNEIKFI